MVTVLLTGFEPFGGAARNPSWDAVEAVARDWNNDATLHTEVLPVEFAASVDVLRAAIDRHSPDLVIAIGLAEGRTAVTPERRGVNVDDARIPDNGGAQPRAVRIEADGPDDRATTLPVDRIVAAIARAGIPASVSDDAGRYVCNHVLYALQGMNVARSGFVHVPATAETGIAGVPTMPIDQIVTAVRIAVEVSLS